MVGCALHVIKQKALIALKLHSSFSRLLAVAALIVLSSNTMAVAQDRSEPATATPEPERSQTVTQESISIVINETLAITDSIPQASAAIVNESAALSDSASSNGTVINDSVDISDSTNINGMSITDSTSINHSMDIEIDEHSNSESSKTEKPKGWSDCLPNSGGRSSFGAIDLLTAPLALYVWRRMRKF